MEVRRSSFSSNHSDETVSVSERVTLFQELKFFIRNKISKIKSKKKDQKKKNEDDKKNKLKEEMIKFNDHKLNVQELEEKHQTSTLNGLSSEEAKQRLLRDGPNSLTERKSIPQWVKFLKQFFSFFPMLLEIGGILCFVAYGIDHSTNDNLYLGIILWLVVIITSIFSFMQESKSSSVMNGFKKLVPPSCNVIRDGQTYNISATELCVGDVVTVKAGERIPADIRIIQCVGFKVDNSSLTGESEPVLCTDKCTDENFLETRNLAFYSTLSLEGTATGLVINIGDSTVIGKIARLASSTDAKAETPLGKEINHFVHIISGVAIALGIIFLIIGFIVKISWVQNVVFVIGIIVANVPEGLLPTVIVALTITAKRLGKRNVLVKNLEAVETLGSCSVIASDKTGTLTQNRMTVVELYYDDIMWSASSSTSNSTSEREKLLKFDENSPSFQLLNRIIVLCNRAVFDSSEDQTVPLLQKKTIGDATESALIKFSEPITPIMDYRALHKKVYEVPFNSKNKFQISIHTQPEKSASKEEVSKEDNLLLLMKGAPERVIDMCKYISISGNIVPLSEENRRNFIESYETFARKGERVLGFAYQYLDAEFNEDYPYDFELNNFPHNGLIFAGLTALMDPPKQSVPESINLCKQAGIRVAMVTGDHPLTAVSIAKQVGIIESEKVDDVATIRSIIEKIKVKKETDPFDLELNVENSYHSKNGVVVKGSEIDELIKEEWDAIIERRHIVFARTSPEQKLMIVEQFQKRGEIVAVTGDGVNDSPALKKADLGCSMGISGSEVSKDAADIILLDDNFASIVIGVEQGRIIFDNLKKSICYTLSSNLAELAPFIAFIILQLPQALSAVLILCIDLGTDMIPAISIAYEEPESDIMKRPPRSRKDRLVSLKLALYAYVYLGLIQSVAGFLCYFLTMHRYGLNPSDLLWTAFTYFRVDGTSPDFHGYTGGQQADILQEAQTAFFIGVVVTRIGCVIVCKTRKSSIFHQGFKNIVFNVGIIFEIALCVGLCYIPGVTTVFGTKSVGWLIWVVAVPFLVFLVGLEEVRKKWVRKNPFGLIARISY